jgi:hypothetical protein
MEAGEEEKVPGAVRCVSLAPIQIASEVCAVYLARYEKT